MMESDIHVIMEDIAVAQADLKEAEDQANELANDMVVLITSRLNVVYPSYLRRLKRKLTEFNAKTMEWDK